MRKWRSSLWLLAGLLTLGCSSSDSPISPPDTTYHEVYEIALPGLDGDYGFGGESPPLPPSNRTITFRFPAKMQSFRELRFVVSGNWNPGSIETTRRLQVGDSTVVVTDTLSLLVNLVLNLTPGDDPGQSFEAVLVPPAGDFLEEEKFGIYCYRECVVDDLLLGAEIAAELACRRDIGDDQAILIPTTGLVDAIRLEALGAVVTR